MTARTYGQFCGLARALEILGEGWGLLVIRDLVLGPKSFTELRATRPKIPAGALSAWLGEMEQLGVLGRRVPPRPRAPVVYELTEYGAELDRVVLRLGLWGARSFCTPPTADVFTLDAAVLSLYSTFRPDAAAGVHLIFELHYGDLVLHARVDNGALQVAAGPYEGADLVLTPQGPAILGLLKNELSAADAVAGGQLHSDGPARHLEKFTRMFHAAAEPAARVSR